MPGVERVRPAVPCLLAAALLGTIFRCAWPLDMEWKADEQRAFQLSQECGRSLPLPWIGMPSGVGTPNPGMSVWAFVALARLTSASTPEELGRAVMLANAAALALLAAFALTRPAAEREAWVWAAALAAVSPHHVQLHRKIWAQSVTALPVVGFLWAWSCRRTAAGAFLWGLLGISLGQIHMTGFFLALAVALFTAALDSGTERVRWGAFLAGTAVGGWPLVPWAREVFLVRGGAPRFHATALLEFGFWSHFAHEVRGLQPAFSLGELFPAFLGEPRVAGTGTSAVLAAFLAATAAVFLTGSAGIRALVEVPTWRERLGYGSPARLLLAAMLVGYGALVTAAGVPFRPHYMAILFPLPYLWVARSALAHRRGRPILIALLVAYAFVSAAFLKFVHDHGGSPHAEYGSTYRAQTSSQRR